MDADRVPKTLSRILERPREERYSVPTPTPPTAWQWPARRLPVRVALQCASHLALLGGRLSAGHLSSCCRIRSGGIRKCRNNFGTLGGAPYHPTRHRRATVRQTIHNSPCAKMAWENIWRYLISQGNCEICSRLRRRPCISYSPIRNFLKDGELDARKTERRVLAY
jgi:hypothetical protein